jgi:glutaredoxin-related protein
MTLNEIKQKINNNDIALFFKGTYKDYKNLYMTVEVPYKAILMCT